MLGVWTGHAAPMVIETLTPICPASSSTLPRMVRCCSVAHPPGENVISTSPKPASAMACNSLSASASSSGLCHHGTRPLRAGSRTVDQVLSDTDVGPETVLPP